MAYNASFRCYAHLTGNNFSGGELSHYHAPIAFNSSMLFFGSKSILEMPRNVTNLPSRRPFPQQRSVTVFAKTLTTSQLLPAQKTRLPAIMVACVCVVMSIPSVSAGIIAADGVTVARFEGIVNQCFHHGMKYIYSALGNRACAFAETVLLVGKPMESCL